MDQGITNNTSEQAPEIKSGYSRGVRIIAVLLLITFIGGAALTYRIQIRETGLQYVGTVLEYASRITQENTGYLSQSTLDRAWRVLRTAVFKPRTFEEFDTYASLSIAKGDYEAAAGYMQGCIKAYSGDDQSEKAILYLRQASLYAIIDDADSAISSLDLAIEADPALGEAYLLRAQLNSQKGEGEKVLEDLKAYESCAGTDPVIEYAMAGLYEMNGEYALAEKCYTTSIDSGDYELAALSSRGRCRILIGDNDGAIEDLQRFFAEGGKDPGGDYYAMLGMCLLENGRLEEAIAELQHAVDKNYQDPALMYDQMFVCAYALEAYDIAAEKAVAAEDLAQKQGDGKERLAELNRNAGLAYFLGGDYEHAGERFVKALDYDKDLPLVNYYAGVCLMSSGKLEDAEKCFAASSAAGEFVSVSDYNRAVCFVSQEQYEEARLCLEHAIEINDDESVYEDAAALKEQLDEFLAQN